MAVVERIVCRAGVFFKGALYAGKEISEHIGKHVLIDDLDVDGGNEILVKTTAGKTICLVEKVGLNPHNPRGKGLTERAMKRKGVKYIG